MKIRVAAAQYDIVSLQSWSEYEAKITRWVERAVTQGAQLLVWQGKPRKSGAAVGSLTGIPA
jgi:predicted amidohydrolase